jgi:hypothetical protein
VTNWPATLVGGVGLLFGLVLAARGLLASDMDPSVFLAVGEEATVHIEYAERLIGDVATRSGPGHDGRFFFAQSNDPWFLDPDEHAIFLDDPRYRGQRMLYPMLASGFGVFPPEVVVWGMLVVNVFMLGIGSLVTARLSETWGGSPWLGFAFAANLGLVAELDFGGGGIVAMACVVAAVLALVQGRWFAAPVLFAAAAMAREVMILFAVGVVVGEWRAGRRPRWSWIVVPVVASLAWAAYLRWRLANVSGVGGVRPVFSPPLVGPFEAASAWLQDPRQLFVTVAIVLVLVGFAYRAIPSRSPLVWGALPFVPLSTILSAFVWGQYFDLARAVAPVFTAAAFLLFVDDGRVGASAGGSAREPRSLRETAGRLFGRRAEGAGRPAWTGRLGRASTGRDQRS